MKRGRKDQLTGGTGDVNPQIITSPIITQPGVDLPVQVQQPLPIPRFPTSTGRNLVIELLGIEVDFLTWSGLAGAVIQYMNVTTNSQNPASINAALSDPKTIADVYKYYFFFTAAAVFEVGAQTYVDLTDNAGHGLLIATDNVYFNLLTQNTGAANSAIMKLEYRWKEVSLTEYIGIVQSQQ